MTLWAPQKGWAADILVIGDSLSAAYGIEEEDGWVNLLRERTGLSVRNAAITGDTTLGGRSRIDQLLAEEQPKLVMIELGGNDGLRGLSLKQMAENLSDMIEKTEATGAEAMLIGITLPPNYGAAFIRRFEKTFARLAEEYDTHFTPNLAAGLEKRLEWIQNDGIHPNELAQPLMLDNVLAHAPDWVKNAGQ
ncbi:MAG: arylesterase [Gammaproteobacteria bacterium]|nr:arylesterase [Gammaproteobacteria bacterium]